LEFRCQALLFDLDGVLVDSRSVIERILRRWAQRHQMDAEAILSVAHGRRTIDTVRELAPHLDVDAEVAGLEAAEIADVDGLVAVPGARVLLVALRNESWTVVTSCGPVLARRRLTAVDLPVPRLLVTGDDVAHGKPAPDCYRLGAERLGQAPAACLAFEDAPAGIAAARGAGARVVALTTTHPAHQLAEADAVVPDFTSVTVRAIGTGFAVTIGAA